LVEDDKIRSKIWLTGYGVIGKNAGRSSLHMLAITASFFLAFGFKSSRQMKQCNEIDDFFIKMYMRQIAEMPCSMRGALLIISLIPQLKYTGRILPPTRDTEEVPDSGAGNQFKSGR
jgi:hypothetical protein